MPERLMTGRSKCSVDNRAPIHSLRAPFSKNTDIWPIHHQPQNAHAKPSAAHPVTARRRASSKANSRTSVQQSLAARKKTQPSSSRVSAAFWTSPRRPAASTKTRRTATRATSPAGSPLSSSRAHVPDSRLENVFPVSPFKRWADLLFWTPCWARNASFRTR